MNDPGQSPPFEQIANLALAEYDLVSPQLSFIYHSENATYKVETSGLVYVLRIHAPIVPEFGDHGAHPAEVRSEMCWLEALQRTNMPVPRPIRNRHGATVTSINDINCTLLEWQAGEVYSHNMESEDTAAQIGVLVGKLHLHSSRWRRPRDFTRPGRDEAYFWDRLGRLAPAVEDGRIEYRDFKTLENSVSILAGMMRRVKKSRHTMGLLHADLHRENFLLHNGQVRMIDFSMAAIGNFMYDVAICMSGITPAFHDIFLVNYDRLFPLPQNYQDLIEGFFIGSYIGTMALWLNHPQGQEILVHRASYIAQEYAARFNRQEHFWFGSGEFRNNY